MTIPADSELILAVSELEVSFPAAQTLAAQGFIQAVKKLSFEIKAGQSLGIVGESGSGKSVSVLGMLGLLDPKAQVRGKALLEHKNMIGAPEVEARKWRGRKVGFIFQEPMTSLNPLMRCGAQVAEVFKIHGINPPEGLHAKVLSLFAAMKMKDPEAAMFAYPHELSGGMRQRVMIAMALALDPGLLIADEPTTALDVTVQAEILMLIKSLRREKGLSLLLITHDLDIVAEHCDQVLVMYGGMKVESGPAEEVCARPLHPYTEGLMAAKPRMGMGEGPLKTIPGQVPGLGQFGGGCPFANRCPLVIDICRHKVPEFTPGTHSRGMACHVRQY